MMNRSVLGTVRLAVCCKICRAGQGRAGQGRAGQGRAGQGRAGQGSKTHCIHTTGTGSCLKELSDLQAFHSTPAFIMQQPLSNIDAATAATAAGTAAPTATTAA